MSESRDSLLSRYRSSLEARARAIAELLPRACSGTVEQRRELLGELHTLKGETRMLGLATMASLVHAIEARAAEESPDVHALSAVADAIVLALSSETAPTTSAELIRNSLEALGETPPEELDRELEASTATPDEGKAEPARATAERWVQVDARLVGELTESLASLFTDFARHAATLGGTALQGGSGLQAAGYDADRLKTRIGDALTISLRLRLTSIEPTFSRLASHIRVLAAERDKAVNVQLSPSGVRIEREILERLNEPLLHLVNNAVEHGIETPDRRGTKNPTPTIELSAEAKGSTVVLKIRDDGRGIDHAEIVRKAQATGLAESGDATLDHDEAFELLFRAGFSTRSQADEVSGRGVGLDVVRRQVENLGGRITIESKLGTGTTFVLTLPASLTQDSLVVFRCGDTFFGLQASDVVAIEAWNQSTASEDSYRFGDRTIPLRSLSRALGQPQVNDERIVVLRVGTRTVAAACPDVLGQFELIRRPLSTKFARVSGVCASAQMDDGNLVLVLDSRFLQSTFGRPADRHSPAASPRRSRPRVLIADDSVVVRNVLTEVLVSGGYVVHAAENGREALAALEDFGPGLVVSDIEMPEMDGFALLREIRQRSETLPVIMVTARSSTEDRHRASALGANAYVTKSEFRNESLLEIVDRFYPGAS